jgi:hypothetical protein
MVTFTQQPDTNATFTRPGKYRITHVFQLQDNDETENTGQYTLSVDVDSWEDIGRTIDDMLTFPEGSGWTLSITVNALGQEEVNA